MYLHTWMSTYLLYKRPVLHECIYIHVSFAANVKSKKLQQFIIDILKYYYPFLVNQIRYYNSKERSWLKEKRINTSFIYTLITYTLRIQFTVTMVNINKFTIRPINVSLIIIMHILYVSNFRIHILSITYTFVDQSIHTLQK